MSGSASAVYEGHVVHRRLQPREHRFRYRLGLLYVDLDELPAALDRHPLWSARRPAPAWFRRADYLRPSTQPLAEAVRDLVAQRGGERPAGPIRLLTHPRYWGYVFNPVSFYYAFDAEDDRPRWVVADVTNTPWGERHAYLLGPLGEPEPRGGWRPRLGKELHVSPFMAMEMDYHWYLSEPGERLVVRIENHAHGQRLFDATLSLRRHPLDRAGLGRLIWRYPWLTVRIIAGIHWQALRLWRKGVPYVPHPDRTRGET